MGQSAPLDRHELGARALFGVLVGLAALLYPNSMTLRSTWVFALFASLLGIATVAYLARLHYDVVRARLVTQLGHAQQREELQALYIGLPKHREESSWTLSEAYPLSPL